MFSLGWHLLVRTYITTRTHHYICFDTRYVGYLLGFSPRQRLLNSAVSYTYQPSQSQCDDQSQAVLLYHTMLYLSIDIVIEKTPHEPG